MVEATIKTTCRKLEQTLWALGVHHLSWEKDADGMTVWVYRNTPKVRQIIDWFREANKKREEGGW